MEAVSFLLLLTGSISVLSLLLLHFTSPEFDPGWRMISEYALGKYKWLLTIFFVCWGTCSLLSALLLWAEVSGFWSTLGILCLILTGIGAIMGGLFDVKHKLHGMAFGIGIPFMPVGALLISYHLIKSERWGHAQFSILASAHAIWISVVLMGITMALLFSGFRKAGIAFGPDIAPPEKLPPGVIGINGYFNRLLVLCYLIWPMLMAYIYCCYKS